VVFSAQTCGIWEEDINRLLRRPVRLVHCDHQSSPATVPGIYATLFDVAKVDPVIGPTGPRKSPLAMPIINQRRKAFVGRRQFAIQIPALLLHDSERP
jgi:branched-chain amino acid transport system substrate-binding protein